MAMTRDEHPANVGHVVPCLNAKNMAFFSLLSQHGFNRLKINTISVNTSVFHISDGYAELAKHPTVQGDQTVNT